jgi:PAS domain-containing protein
VALPVPSVPPSLPDFLAPAFDVQALEQLDSSIAVIDAEANIMWVNPAWERFARENGAGETRPRLSSYLDGITPPLRDFYRAVFAAALATGAVFEQEYECSSPDRRRIFHFRALPIDDRGLILEHSLVAENEPEGGDGEHIVSRYLDEGNTLLQCSHCRRVRRPDTQAWDWVRAWAARPHPATSHGLCPLCVGFYWGRRRPASRSGA